jgi:hypothetical protein
MNSPQNPKPSDLKPIHSVYWLHLPDHSDPFTQGYIGITHRKNRQKEHRDDRRIPPGFIFTVLAENLTRFEAAKMEWEHRKQTHIGWNTKVGGGKYIRALLGTQLTTIETGLLTQEYDFANKVARFTYLAGTEIDAPAIKAYCRDLSDGPPCQIEVIVGDERINLSPLTQTATGATPDQ